MNAKIEVSLVIPAYNEGENLAPLTAEIEAAMKIADVGYEIIFVDDGSTDESPKVLEELRRTHPTLGAIRHRTNFGQSAGQITGFRAAKGKIIITMDADLQHDPADIPKLLGALTGDVDCVCGFRAVRNDNFVRRASSKIANGFRNAITGDKVTDSGCTYRAIRKEALAEVPVFNGMHRFLPTILRFQGFKVVEIAVNHRGRHRGISKYGINNRLWRGIRDCFAIRWYRARAVSGSRLSHE